MPRSRAGLWFLVILEVIGGRRSGSVMALLSRAEAEREAAHARKQPSVRAVEYARTGPRVGRLLFAWVRDGELP